MFRDSSTQPFVPAFTQKDFHYFVHTGLPTQGTFTEDLGQIQFRSTQLLSQIQPLTRGKAQSQIRSTSQLRDRHKATQSQLSLIHI